MNKESIAVHEQEPTQDELIERVNSRKGDDMFGFEINHYAEYLNRESLVKLGSKINPEEPCEVKPWSRDAVIAEMKDYLAFAFGKANDCRGLSANRSISHYLAWTWLSGDREFSAEILRHYTEDYQFYGKLILRKIAERYGWDWSELDDGELTNG